MFLHVGQYLFPASLSILPGIDTTGFVTTFVDSDLWKSIVDMLLWPLHPSTSAEKYGFDCSGQVGPGLGLGLEPWQRKAIDILDLTDCRRSVLSLLLFSSPSMSTSEFESVYGGVLKLEPLVSVAESMTRDKSLTESVRAKKLRAGGV